MVNKSARVQILKQRWNNIEQQNSWKMATSIKTLFYFLASSRKEEAAELLDVSLATLYRKLAEQEDK